MKTLILIDRPNWAYHRIALALQKYTDLDLAIEPIKGNVNKIEKVYKKYDQFLVMGWQTYENVRFLPKKYTLTGVHGHHSWDKHRTAPDRENQPPESLHKRLMKFKGVNAVSMKLWKLFPYSSYTPNGADTETFYRTSEPFKNKRVVVGCAYSGDKHEWRKGVETFIKPAAKKAGARLKMAKRDVPFNEMRQYYNSIDIYVCASSSEGMSLSVLEAMACGRPVISTWPSELPTYNVARNVDAIAFAIENAQFKIPQFKYSWKRQAKYWERFINGAV